MPSFSPLRFQTYARELSKAVYQMIDRDKLRHEYPGGLRTRVIGSDKFVTLGDKTVMVSQMATDDEIAAALHLDQATAPATPLPPAPTISASKPIDDAPTSNITGLQSGAFQNALVQMRKRMADKQRQAVNIIAGAVASGEAKMDAAANEVAAKVDKEISAAIQEFAQHTNGGPV